MSTRSGSPPSALAVRLHGRRIGVITRLAGDRHIFAFEEDHVDDPGRPTLSLAFKSASEELVAPLRGRRHAVAVARLRPAGDDSLSPQRPVRAHVRRNEGHPWNHQGADSPVCGQGGPGRRSALARGAGDGGRDSRSVAPSRCEIHVAGRYSHLAGPSSHRRGRQDARVRQAQRRGIIREKCRPRPDSGSVRRAAISSTQSFHLVPDRCHSLLRLDFQRDVGPRWHRGSCPTTCLGTSCRCWSW